MHILIWKIENQQYAIDLAVVDYILLAAAITRLPHAPDYILGALNVHGQVIPVINMRKLLGLPEKEIETKDYFILAHVHQKPAILWVDNVERVRLCKEKELISAQEVLPDLEAVDHVLKENGQIILLYDLEKLIPSHAVTV